MGIKPNILKIYFDIDKSLLYYEMIKMYSLDYLEKIHSSKKLNNNILIELY